MVGDGGRGSCVQRLGCFLSQGNGQHGEGFEFVAPVGHHGVVGEVWIMPSGRALGFIFAGLLLRGEVFFEVDTAVEECAAHFELGEGIEGRG